MRLLDQVAQSRDPVRVELPGKGVFELPGAAAMAASVAETPVRYVLGPDVREACHEIAARWPELMDPGSPGLRLPVPAMWIEWDEPEPSGEPCRNGMLVRAGDGDRQGTVHTFWNDRLTGAERAQAHVRFDLDRVISPGQDRCADLARYPALRLLAPHFLMSVEPEWLLYFSATSGGPQTLRTAVARCAVQARPNFAVLIGLLRLLAVRRNVDERRIERQELNRLRVRRGKPDLLDHVEVSLAIGRGGSAASSHGGSRAPSRQHLVRGHLVNRRGTIFWRSPHLRGCVTATGLPVKRNVNLSVAPGFRPSPAMWPAVLAAE
jgi:hypothetical protein